MSVKVELHRDVLRCLENRLTLAERDSFVQRLQEVRQSPIRNSEIGRDERFGGYALRFFRFATRGRWIALFSYDMHDARIKVLECRLLKPAPPSELEAEGDPPPAPRGG